MRTALVLCCSVAQLETKPVQTADIDFSADVERLRAAIRAFGVVDASGPPAPPVSAGLKDCHISDGSATQVRVNMTSDLSDH